MSQFEFVIVIFAIILGLAISEVVAGWADQIRARSRLHAYPLQLFSSGFVLFLSIHYIWLLWQIRDIEWTFVRFVGFGSPTLVLALASRVCKVDTAAGAPSIREQYFQNSPSVYYTLAFLPLILLLASFLFRDLRAAFPDVPNIIGLSLLRFLLLTLFIWLAVSRKERFHWFALGFLWLANIWFVVRLGKSLSGVAS